MKTIKESIQMYSKVRLAFRKGRRYTHKDAREVLQKIYDEYGITRKAMVSHLDGVIATKPVKIMGERYIDIL